MQNETDKAATTERTYVYPAQPWLEADDPACEKPEGEIPVMYRDLIVSTARLNAQDHFVFDLPDELADQIDRTIFPKFLDEVVERDEWGRPTLTRLTYILLEDILAG